MKNSKIIMLTLLLVSGIVSHASAKVFMPKAYAYAILRVAETATQEEVEASINLLRSQKVIRPAGFWIKVAKAYEVVTGKEFNLFDIYETAYTSFTIDFEKVS